MIPLEPKIDFSVIDTELKAYLIGIFYADAAISDYVLQLNLSIKDKDYIEKLSKILGVETHLTDIKNKTGKTYQSISIRICNKRTINDLKKFGFIKRKSYQRDDIVFRNIPDNLKRHFIRGYFDGDGTIFISKYKNKNFDWKESVKCCIGFVSINKELLDSISEYLSHILDMTQKKLKIENSRNLESNIKYHRLIYSGNVISKKVMGYLYENSTIYMDRKYHKYKEIQIFEPKNYSFHKGSNKWRCVYKDENGKEKYKGFKNEMDAKLFLDDIKNPNYKIEEYKPKGYYKVGNSWRAIYKDENKNRKSKYFKNEIDAKDFLQKLKNKIKTYEKFIIKMVR